jgi:hypothetical protein
MERKFKFVIPDHLESIMKESIQKLNGKTFISHGLGVYECDGQKVALPPEFMVELSDFDAWFDSESYQPVIKMADGCNFQFYDQMKACHEWTLENEKLKHPVKAEEKVELVEGGPIGIKQLFDSIIEEFGPGEWEDSEVYEVMIKIEQNHAKRVKPVIDAAINVDNNLCQENIDQLRDALETFKTLDKND